MQRRQNSAQPAYDKAADIAASQQVIIAGYGRFGQIIGRLLAAQGYEITVLDHSPSQIELLRRFGNTVFYGDAARKDLLEAAGADRAKLLVIAIDNPDKTLDIVQHVKQSYPHLKVAARAKDRRHAYQLMRLNVHAFNRETFDSAIMLGIDALKLLGNDEDDARRAGKLFREHDIKTMQELAEVWGDEKSYGVAVKQRQADLKQVLAEDREAQRKLKTCGK